MAPLLPNPVFSLDLFLLNFYLCLLDLKIRAATCCRCIAVVMAERHPSKPRPFRGRSPASKNGRKDGPWRQADVCWTQPRLPHHHSAWNKLLDSKKKLYISQPTRAAIPTGLKTS
ncbi:hypothetical protein C8F04DRAFT_1107800 [Mycena alexandri]|uniref:Secreted protein n=1 Tax=Mycena alexandri TaxID=1745969 RepID=A0AAD6STF3_9AGAR|nr:hypothetical protein C8F04DRAFT_1107800 [Mycena alexandri]